mgnify:CR=1 FL=1
MPLVKRAVDGPVSAVQDNIVIFDDSTGKKLKDSGKALSDYVEEGDARLTDARDPTAHAEMLAITQAAQALNNWRLENCTLYVSLEPCPMCAGAMIHARVSRLVFGTRDPKGGAVVSTARMFDYYPGNHMVEYLGGVREESCAEILSSFFMQKRL